MDQAKKERLESAGWRVGDAKDFLGLSEAEQSLVEFKLSLAAGIRTLRREAALTQTQVASLIGSSQSRVAKMEAADPTVSFDLLLRTLLLLGAGPERIASLFHPLPPGLDAT